MRKIDTRSARTSRRIYDTFHPLVPGSYTTNKNLAEPTVNQARNHNKIAKSRRINWAVPLNPSASPNMGLAIWTSVLGLAHHYALTYTQSPAHR
jgi:hypothetical protein